MLWLWILGILAALLALLCLTRVGVQISFGEELTLKAAFGWFRFTLLPRRDDPKKAEKRRKKAEAKRKKAETAPKKQEKEKKPFPKPELRDMQEAIKALWPPLRKALARTWRGIRVDPLKLYLTVGGRDDPASAAELYGYLQGGVWTAMPQLERLMDIPNPLIHLDIDFTASKHRIAGEAGITLRVGTIFRVAFGMGIPALRWLLRFIRQKKRQDKQKAPGQTDNKELAA